MEIRNFFAVRCNFHQFSEVGIQIEVIFLDLHLSDNPEENDGFTFLAKREQEKFNLFSLIIMISSEEEGNIIQECKNRGADYYHIKPIQSNKFTKCEREIKDHIAKLKKI